MSVVTLPSSFTTTSSYSVAPMAWAIPPSICPRHWRGLTTTPASAACTLCRIFSSPVPRFTATRKPCTLKATERGVPPQRGQFDAGIRGGLRQFSQCHGGSVDHHGVTVEDTRGRLGLPDPGGKGADPDSQLFRGCQGRLAGHHGAGGAERTGVVLHQVGVGLPDRHPGCLRGQRRGRE